MMKTAPFVLCVAFLACGAPTESEDAGGSSGGIGTTSAAVTSEGVTGEGVTGEAVTGESGGVTGAISEAWMTGGAEGSTAIDGTTGDPLAECPRLRVMVPAGEVLNVRPSPSTAGEPVAMLANGAIVDAVALVEGEAIDGVSLWYEISSASADGFVFSTFVACTLDEPAPVPDGFWLPFTCGSQVEVTQGNDGDVSHQGKDLYAFDFGVGTGTPIVAMAAGTVQHIYDQTKPGDPCYDGGGAECGPYGNLVVVLHGDDTASYYKHLSQVQVSVGQVVARGEQVGLSGTTGYSTGRHLHAMRQGNCGAPKCQSIPLSFVDAGVPVEGDFVTSMNCP